ncbi:MAG: hypothetical protein K2L05_01950 [Muribaculaceae bacterium]|nr:hypothetical protein [Muribaculaceae bacterium]
MDEATLDEQKDFIGRIAEELSALLDVETVHTSIDFLDYLAKAYGDIDDDDYYYGNRIKQAGRSYELYQFADIQGIYEWNGEEFIKTGNSNKCIFRIPNDKKYGRIELEVEASNDSQDWTVENYDGDRVDVRVPYSINGKITANGKVMMSQTLSNSGRSGSNVTANSKTVLGGLVVEASGNASSSNGSSKSTVYINGQQIASGNVSLTGKNLTNSVIWAEEDYEYISDMVSNATIKSDVLGKIQMNYTVKMSRALEECDDVFNYGYSWSEYSSKSEALKACKSACDIYNKAYAGYLTFNNTSKKQAYITFIPENDEYYSEWENAYCGEYYVEQAIKFADGTTYSDEMFDGVFDRVIDTWEYLFY